MDKVDFIMAFEGGELTKEELVEGFQSMIDDGSAWKLQGIYGRVATRSGRRSMARLGYMIASITLATKYGMT